MNIKAFFMFICCFIFIYLLLIGITLMAFKLVMERFERQNSLSLL
ncbi:MAG: hypothetical protein JG763_2054 [Shewanella sp.]|jgi:hypothetical protein|nr:hypothetical protein [Shewanella sp.]